MQLQLDNCVSCMKWAIIRARQLHNCSIGW